MGNQGKKQHAPVSIDAWHRSIAERSNTCIKDVKRVLDNHGIEPQSTTPIRKAIRFHKLYFSGIKKGTTNDGDFSFTWDNLTTGLYGVLSEDNLVGKSSVLRLLYSILRGDFSSVSEPVLEWINNLEAILSIGTTKLELVLLRREKKLYATLTRSQNETEVIEYKGDISELSGTLEQLFMKELNFEKFFATKKSKILVPHGWPAIASALFISGINGAIVGDLIISGLPQKLLQCFIGLSWISTQSRAAAVYKIEQESMKSEKKTENINGLSEAIRRKQAELDALPSSEYFEKQKRKWRIKYDSIEKEIKEFTQQYTQKRI
ncbi:MAG: hypothetical protein D3924_09500 [Candidatus Electrothrix sp. AR4]|nr:hypothetical protein [Candidatus Electrothrix sp. AR4]